MLEADEGVDQAARSCVGSLRFLSIISIRDSGPQICVLTTMVCYRTGRTDIKESPAISNVRGSAHSFRRLLNMLMQIVRTLAHVDLYIGSL